MKRLAREGYRSPIVRLVEASSVADYLTRYYRPERLQPSTLLSYETDYFLHGYICTSHFDNITGEMICWPTYPALHHDSRCRLCRDQVYHTIDRHDECINSNQLRGCLLKITRGLEIHAQCADCKTIYPIIDCNPQCNGFTISMCPWCSSDPKSNRAAECRK